LPNVREFQKANQLVSSVTFGCQACIFQIPCDPLFLFHFGMSELHLSEKNKQTEKLKQFIQKGREVNKLICTRNIRIFSFNVDLTYILGRKKVYEIKTEPLQLVMNLKI